MRTCSKCKTVTDNFSNTDRYCKSSKSLYDRERQKNVTLCSKCKEQIDDKKSYCKSIYDPEAKDLILKKVVEMNRIRV